MRVRIEFELTQEVVALGILEQARLEATSTGYLDPKTRTTARRWALKGLRAHGLNLWASVEDAPPEAREWAFKRAAELFPELPLR